ncbi:MAG: prephenate/arogenate dehydrogenase family protein [Alphaproteobacteria bacterium]
MSRLFQRVAIIGCGLIGSSLARVIRRGQLAGHVAVADGSADVRAVVERLKLADSVHEDSAAAVAGADLVMLCVPPGAMAAAAGAMASGLAPGAIVSDVGSTKASVIADVAPLLPAGVALVPGHPVAGTENSGPESGFAALFQDRWCILTPGDDVPAAAVESVAALWRAAGMNVETMDAAYHDRILAMTSHLPHLIAYSMVAAASDLEDHMRSEAIKFSAGGFRDFTRIAASDPIMWRDVFLKNSDAVLEMISRFSEELVSLRRAIRHGDGEMLHAFFSRARELRRGVIAAGQAGRFIPTETEPSADAAKSED